MKDAQKLEESEVKKIVLTALKEGYQLTEDALETLKNFENPLDVLLETIRYLKHATQHCFVLSSEHILSAASRHAAKSERCVSFGMDIPELKILQQYDESIRIEGSLEEFHAYFHNRYVRMKKILEERGLNFLPLSEAMRTKMQEVNVAVMVLNRRDTGKAIIFDCEDPSAHASVIVPKSASNVITKAERVLVDYVVGMRLKKINDGFVAQDIMMPDVPVNNDEITSGPDVISCFISDLHIGSENFRDDLFENFLDWVSRGRDGEVKKLKYIFILGDLVDGVGVYPGQEKELKIASMKEQFMLASKIISEIPKDIELVYIPGNHEPIRRALPQPSIPEEYRKILEKNHRIRFAGNPVRVLIGNKLVYAYHGQSLDDLIQCLPDVSYSTLQQKMGKVLEAVIQARHLAPYYGQSTPLLPLKEDPLLIDTLPAMLCTAHVHVATTTYYRKILLANAGCWQEQTSYQKAVGLEPTVGTALLVNFYDMSAKIKKF